MVGILQSTRIGYRCRITTLNQGPLDFFIDSAGQLSAPSMPLSAVLQLPSDNGGPFDVIVVAGVGGTFGLQTTQEPSGQVFALPTNYGSLQVAVTTSAPPPIVPINDAFWSTGGWWDLSTVAGVSGAPIAVSVAPQSAGGLGTFTPGFFTGPTNPIIFDQAIGGKRGLITSQTADNYLENDALAAIINGTNKTWSIFFDYQQNNVGVPLLNNCVAGWGSSGGIGAQDNIRVNFMNNVSGGSHPESLSIFQAADVGFTATQNNLSQLVSFDYFRFAASYDGTTLSTYINGAVASVVPTTWQSAAMVITKMMWGAWPVNNVGFEGSNGYLRRLGVRAVPTSPADVAAVDANMVANDYTLPRTDPRTPQWLVAGASVINGSHDEINGMGVRYAMAIYTQLNRLSWDSLGGPQGFYALRGTSAIAGASAPEIATQVATNVTTRTRLVVVDLGDEEIDLSQTALQVQTAIASALAAIRTSVYAVAPLCRIAVNTIIPFSESGFNAVCIAVNAQLPSIWNASDAAFAGFPALVRWDANTAIGGPSYVQANYTAAGDDHPNNQGYTLMGTALIAAIGTVLSGLSPT